jgi:hypothetical protein
MSSSSIFRLAARTRLSARPAALPRRTLSPRTAVPALSSSFATTTRRWKDHDAADPHHEESFEEFTARYVLLLANSGHWQSTPEDGGPESQDDDEEDGQLVFWSLKLTVACDCIGMRRNSMLSRMFLSFRCVDPFLLGYLNPSRKLILTCATAQSKQCLRIRSRPLTNSHHRCSPCRSPRQRLPNCRPDIRRYVARVPLIHLHVILTITNRYQGKGGEQDTVRGVYP